MQQNVMQAYPYSLFPLHQMEVKCSTEPPKKLSARLQTVSNEGKLMYFRRESFAIIRIKNLPVGLEDSILLCPLKRSHRRADRAPVLWQNVPITIPSRH